MSWSLDFISKLSNADVLAYYVLESVAVPDDLADYFGGDLKLSSYPLPGYLNVLQLAGSGISYGELRPRSGSASPMSWSVGLSGEENATIRRAARRGQVVQLRIGFERDLSTFTTVALGTIYQIDRKGGRWAMQIRGLSAALVSRITASLGEGQLFHDLASTTIATAGYAVADPSLEVADNAGFRDDGGGIGVVKVTPDSGDDFYLTYSGKGTGPDTFTGLSSAGKFETTAAAAAIGNAVTEVAYIVGQPIEIIRKILLSTGTGNNSAHDTLPASWGFGLPEALVNVDDMTAYVQDVLPASGSDAQEFIADAAPTNSKALLDGWLNTAGYFLTTAQGTLTCRAVLDPVSHSTPGYIDITDTDIAEIVEYSAYDRGSPSEFDVHTVTDAGGASSTNNAVYVETLPTQPIAVHILAGLYSANANRANIRGEHRDRLKIWDLKVPERIRLRLAGWRGAVLAMGDTVSLTTSLIVDREGKPYNQRRGLVIQAGADWFGSSSTVTILFRTTVLVEQPAPA